MCNKIFTCVQKKLYRDGHDGVNNMDGDEHDDGIDYCIDDFDGVVIFMDGDERDMTHVCLYGNMCNECLGLCDGDFC